MIPKLWIVLLLSLFAHAKQNFSNATFQSSIVRLNITSSLTATGDNGEWECQLLWRARYDSSRSFDNSRSSASANGLYRIISEIKTAINYSSLLYTLDDGYPRLISLIPTATYLSTSLHIMYPNLTNPIPDCTKIFYGTCGLCDIQGGKVELFYWPMNTTSSHPNMKITSNDAERFTSVIDGFTLTSPTVYLSFARLGTYNRCGTGSYFKTIIGVDPSGLTSIEYHDGQQTQRRFNFEDLNEDIPASVYFNQDKCQPDRNKCIPIRPKDYNPPVALPSEILSLYPGWEHCGADYSYDPPRILRPAQSLAGPISAPNADPVSATIRPQVSLRPLGPVRTVDPHIVLSPSAAPDAPKEGNPSVKDPPNADPLVKNPAAPSGSPDKSLADSGSPQKTSAAPGSPDKLPAASGSPNKSQAAQNSPVNNLPGTDGLTQDPSSSGGSSSGREAAIITLGSQIYTVNANSHFIINSKTLSGGGPAAIVSGETVSLNTKGVIVGGSMHAFSAIQSNLDTAEAMMYTEANGKKVIVIGSSTLSAGGEAANVGGLSLSVGANGLIIGSKTIDFSAFGTSKPSAGGLLIGGKSLSLAGIHYLTSPGELQMPRTSPFPPASPTTDPDILPTVVIISAQKITVDAAGQYRVNGKTFTLKDPYTQGANLATMISDQLVASAAQATAGPSSPTIVRAQPPGSSSSTSVGLGQRIFHAFNGGGGASGSRGGGGGGGFGGGQGEGSRGREGGASGPVAATNNTTSGETGAGIIPYTRRAAGRFSCNYTGWLLMFGVSTTWGFWDGSDEEIRWH